jgi:hypothetical protein
MVGQNYPNPVSRASGYETVVPYTLPSDASVRLTVHDAAGRLVQDRDFGMQQAGDYHYPFDARRISTGLATYRLYVNGRVAGERRMLVLR